MVLQVKSENDEIEFIMENDKLVKKYNVSDWGVRYTQCVILLLTYSVSLCIRASMGVALVAMIQKHNQSYILGNETVQLNSRTELNRTHLEIKEEDFEVHGFLNALLITPPFPKFEWSKKIQDMLLSSFFWGYVVLQIPAGQLAHKFGARRLLIGAMFINCIVGLILPTASYYGGWICTSLCRLLQGIGQGCVCPSIHMFLGKWSPLEERGRMSGVIYGGHSFGTVLGLSLTGLIASSCMDWPGIFYFYGIMSGINSFILWYMLADTPSEHRTISLEEKRYIEDALNQHRNKVLEIIIIMIGHDILTMIVAVLSNHVLSGATTSLKKLPVPWKSILSSPGMMAIAVAHSGSAWLQLTLFLELPAYMDKVMGVNIKANGLLIALPYMVSWFTNFFFGWLTDMLISKKYLNVTHTRKLANTIATSVSSFGLIALAYAPNNLYVVESILITICGFTAAAHFGFFVNHVDISPNFAGTMMSVSNVVAHLFGSMAPLAAGLIITDTSDATLWRTVFFLTSGFCMAFNVIYVIFGTSKLADWNDPDYNQEDSDDEKISETVYEEKRNEINGRSKETDNRLNIVYSRVTDKCC